MAKGIAFGALGALLVVGVVIGVVATVTNSKDRKNQVNGSGDLTSSSKSVTALCASTNYKESCEQTLGSALNGTASLDEAARVSIEAIVTEAEKALKLSAELLEKSTDKDGFEICKKLLADAVEGAKASLSQIGNIKERTDDIQTWLSSIISYRTTCLEELSDLQLKTEMESGLANTTEFTSNALALVQDATALLGLFNLDFGSKRRLLSAAETDAEGYPTWMSAGDRKLLAAHANTRLRPHVVVAQDGSGNFRTINDALKAMPKKYSGHYVIYVKAGVYKENVLVSEEKETIIMYGDGGRKTIVTGNKNFNGGVKTYYTATFAVDARGFIGMRMAFVNTAGPGGEQAVALRVKGDMSAFFNCRIDAYQDTLYVQANRQFYRSCTITGTVDFIFGDSSTVIQNCKILARLPGKGQKNLLTAQGRKDPKQNTAIVIHNCRILADKQLFPVRFQVPTYLGRPWKEYSRTIVMESLIGDHIRPEGWLPWVGDSAPNTIYYAEYGNTGPGAGTSGRVNWRGYHVINKATASKFAVDPFITPMQWLRHTGVKYTSGLLS